MLLSLWTILLLSSAFVPDPASASGWYVRGAAGYERSLDTNFSDTDCASTHPPALTRRDTGSALSFLNEAQR